MNSQENLIKKPTKNNMDYKIIEFKSITEKTWYNEMSKGVGDSEAFYRFILYWQISSTILLWGILLKDNIRLLFRSIFGVTWMIVCGAIFLYYINDFSEYVPYSSNEIMLGSVFVLQPILWFFVLFIGTIVIKYKSK